MVHPLVSVVIPTRNNLQFLFPCLVSLARQTLADHEIIVVDNGSPARVLNEVSRWFPSVKIVALRQNGFFCRAANQGIRASSGTFIALINDDTVLTPTWMENAVCGFDIDSSVGSIASLIMSLRDPQRIDSAGDHLLPNGVAGNLGHGQQFDQRFASRKEVFSACAAGAVYRKSVIELLCGFDECFEAYYDDVDLGFRAQLLGYRCLYLPDAIMYHYGSASNYPSWKKMWLVERNLIWNLLKNMPTSLLKKYTPEIATQLRWPLQIAGTPPIWSAWLLGKIASFIGVHNVLSARTRVQRRKRISCGRLEALLLSHSSVQPHL